MKVIAEANTLFGSNISMSAFPAIVRVIQAYRSKVKKWLE